MDPDPTPPPTASEIVADPAAFVRLTPLAETLVLVAIFFAILMGAMDSLVVSTILKTIATDLHQSNGVTFVAGAYLISSTVSIPIFARLSDIASRRNVLLAGLGIFIVGSALAGLSQNLTELIAFRGIQGFGGGGVFPVAIATVAVLFAPETRARVIGILSAAAGVAIVAGPLLGNFIVSVTTWRWVFYINLPFGILAILVLSFGIGPLRGRSTGSVDAPGAALLAGWVACLMLPLTLVSENLWTWSDPAVIGLLAATVVLFAGFLVWELRVPSPLVPLRLLRHRVIGASSGIMFFTGVVFSSLVIFLSLVVGLVLLHGTSSVRDIIYFLAVPLVLGAGLSGQLLTRVAYRTLVAPSLFIAGVVGFLLADLSSTTHLWVLAFGFLPVGGLALPLIPMGFGLGLALGGTTVAVQNEAPPAEVGAAIGLTRFLQSLGGALGITLLTVFQAWRAQTLSSGSAVPTEAAEIASNAEVFLILAVCVVVAAVCALGLTGKVAARTPRD